MNKLEKLRNEMIDLVERYKQCCSITDNLLTIHAIKKKAEEIEQEKLRGRNDQN